MRISKRGLVLMSLLIVLTIPPVVGAQDENTGLFWWNDRVFYEIFVRSFHDSDGDGIGDLNGVIEKLDYLNDGDPTTTTDLGVTGIWLMPIMESPSYHGYDVTNYGRIEPDYGSTRDFQRLMQEAHERGIVVIVDLVINHTSREHPWFRASSNGDARYADWYVWEDRNPGYGGPDNQRVWHERNNRFYYALFWDGMPDLNLRNPAVTQEIYDITRIWLDVMGVDGFRLDAIKHLIEEGQEQESTASTLEWMAAYNDYIDSINPNALTVGEVWESNFVASQYVPEQVDLVFDFDVATAILTAVRQNRPDAMVSILNRVADLYPTGQYATFITNHDQNRVMSELRGNLDEGKIAASLLLTTPGVPFLYYGEEIGMTGVKPDERIRTPMRWESSEYAGFSTVEPWQPLSEDEPEISVSEQNDAPGSLLNHYRSLIHLRNNHPALMRGSLSLVEVDGSRNVFAFIREADDERILVLINLDEQEVSGYQLLLEGISADGGEVLLGEEEGFTAPSADEAVYVPYETLQPYSTTIIRLGDR